MAWMLQPRSYAQALGPNWYNVSYRRTGVYKGMGGLGQSECDPTSASYDPGYCLANLPETLPTSTAEATIPALSTLETGVQSFLTASYLPWILGGALGLVLLLDLSGRRR